MSFFDSLFGKKKTVKEQVREYKRTVDRACRDLDRERTNLQRQEKKIITDIKKAAKDGQMGAAKIMAKDLVRTRRHIDKFYRMRTQLQAVGLRLQGVSSTAAMTEAMKGVTKAMMAMNKQVNLPQLQKIMMEFEKQNEQMDMREEMVGDAIDDAMEEDEDEEESEEVINKVLDEIGFNLDGSLQNVPSVPLATEAATEGEKKEDDELQARLDNLRKT